MTQRGYSLLGWLCKLYRYHFRHWNETCRTREREEKRLAAMGGGLEAPDRLEAEAMIPHEAAEIVRLRLQEVGRLTRGSEAWKLAVERIIARAKDGPNVRENLETYCSFELSRQGSFDEQWVWLALAEGAIRGRAMQFCGRGKRDVSEFRDKLAKRLERDPAYGSLTKTIARLDDEGKGDDLLREVWNLYREEAEDADLPPVPPSPSGGHGGEMQPVVPKRPSDNAFKAWRLRDFKGFKTQQEIADEMSEQLRHKVHQGEVSRWLDEVDAYHKAGGIFPDLPGLPGEPQSIDPNLIDMGERQDHLTLRQRQRRDSDAD